MARNKTKLLVVRMTEAELATVHRLAALQQMTISDFIRAAAVTAAVVARNPGTTVAMLALPEEWVELRKEVIPQLAAQAAAD